MGSLAEDLLVARRAALAEDHRLRLPRHEVSLDPRCAVCRLLNEDVDHDPKASALVAALVAMHQREYPDAHRPGDYIDECEWCALISARGLALPGPIRLAVEGF